MIRGRLKASQKGSNAMIQPLQTHLIYEFGDFELDALRRVLVSRADGRQVSVTGRVLEALVYLVERPGQLIDKRELMEALWPHVVVEEGSLTQTIHSLRRALGERPNEHRYVATVPGRGYRFVAEVNVRQVQPESHAAPSRWGRTVLAGAALSVATLTLIVVLLMRGRGPIAEEVPARAPPSIAVLPFIDLSLGQDQEHFAEGLSEEILNLLAHSENLRVIARTSSFAFKSRNTDVRTIAQQLAVTHVLEGSVRKAGERVRITAQLIDGSSGTHIWSETYDRDVQDVIGVQREIASEIADALHITLRSGEDPGRAGTTSMQAYDHYLQGRHLFHRRSSSDLQRAKTHFEQAIRIDPGYARAWVALAGVYFVARYEDSELSDASSKWGEAVQRALALAPDLAETNVRAAQYYWYAGDRDAASMHVARAVAIDPADPLVVSLSLSQAIVEGHMEEAVALQRRMIATDPLSATHRGNLGVLLTMTGQLGEAQTELERALELSPDAEVTIHNLAHTLILRGQIDDALDLIHQLPAGYRRDSCLALAHFVRGDVADGDAMLTRLLAQSEARSRDPAVALAIAEVYAARNDPEQAFKWLDLARRRWESEPGPMSAADMTRDVQTAPFLKTLHADPRWNELLAAIGAQ
jgi:TolB-like protein/DNA-binding winged helix-turn-helix (wHTH) protein/Tfp pilus assembly protein PilF